MGNDSSTPSVVNRRRFVQSTGVAAIAGLAGCSGNSDGNGGDGGGDGGNGSGDGGDNSGGGGESNYPNQLINFIVPYGPGGGTDIYARHFVPLVSDILSNPMQVENIEGAGATRGMTEISKAEPNGYTIGMGVPPGTGMITYLAAPDSLEISYESFTPICIVGESTHVVMANPDLGVDYEGLIELYQSGEASSFGGQAVGSMVHIAALQIRDNHGMDFNEYIAYDGSGPTAQAIASGDIAAGIASETAAEPFAEEGDVEVIADLSDNGGLVMDIPSVTDYGYENVNQFSIVSRAILGPEGLPENVVDTLEGAFEEAVKSEESAQWEEETGNVVTWGDREVCRDRWHGALERIPQQVDMEMIREEMGVE